ncbi:MAG TPA: iron-sulfur cluster assembly accessory protein [Chthonomonadaceae bacterium]|nr:iron-sulfur cluster assembly accessory protein [Chthonomonadaceae bacterium]
MTDTLQEVQRPILTITPAAVARIKQLMQKQGSPNLGLRVGVKGGGCSGLSYVMTLDEKVTDRDLVFEIEGLKVMVDRKSARFIEGTTLDYSLANLLEGGWKWSNPNAARSCGCGTSFTPKL